MDVHETQLPGVGTRFAVRFESGGELVVLAGNDGDREVYWREEPDADSDRLWTMSEPQARKLAEIFDGTYVQPVDDDLEDAWEDAEIEWVEIAEGSPAAGRSVRDLGIRTRTGVTVIAVQRGSDSRSNPDADFVVEAGDTLVVVGSAEGHDALESLLADER